MASSNEPSDGVLPEPIAIIGAACRFSGTASSQDGLWQLLTRGSTTWSSNARGRFKLESFWHPNAQLSGSTNSQGLHLLQQDPGAFDNDFFSISGLEAKAIDPNQRLLLEVAYEAFENAGLSLESLEGSQTGVICAAPYCDYDQIQGRDPEVSPMYRFTGTGPSILANRISYVFDLKGPSMVVDTACSSSLVAIHEACRTLRAGDADQILVGGANLILDPDKLTNISSMGFLSPHGRCYSFDSRASGYGRGEGIAAVLLKPLGSAIRDGDSIRAVIRGSATGSDGRTQGITLPSPTAQYNVIQKAYKSAGLNPRETPYVEAHGTGTNAGDNAEIEAFAQAFSSGERTEKLLVGSVKANLGHTEGVAGLASLMKSILMLENGLVVPNPNFRSANVSLDLEGRKIHVPTKGLAWPIDTPRRISINGTGYGGVNAHIIIEAWPSTEQSGTTVSANGKSKSQVLVWSHRREDGLIKMVAGWKRFVMALQAGSRGFPLEDMAFTLGTRRSHLSRRVGIIASNAQELLDGIAKVGLGSIRPVKADSNTTLCFVFTGQGAQWARMGLELMSTYDVFSSSLRRSETQLLQQGATWRLLEELERLEEESRINDAVLAQPCCTAIQIALVDLLASWGVHPALVCGHSSGEIAAAYAAGVLTAEDAIKVAYFRGQAVRTLREVAPDVRGAMLAVGLSESDVHEYLGDVGDAVKVACVNSPSSVTLSGDSSAIDGLVAVIDSVGVFYRRLAVDVAYHSHHMALVEQYYLDSIQGLDPQSIKSQVRMVSSVTGREVQGPELDAAYWTRNLVSTVRFSDALAGLVRIKGKDSTHSHVFVEIGPHAALRGPSNQVLKSLKMPHSTHYTSCLQRGVNSESTCLLLAQELFEYGVPIDLDAVNNPHNNPRRILSNLPSYKWHHESIHWNESRRSAVYRSRKFPRHELLGSPSMDGISAEPCWRAYFKLSEMPWIRGHCINGQVVFAASGFVSMILEAMKRHCLMTSEPWQRRMVHLRDIVLERPLFIPNSDHGAEVFTVLRPYANSLRQPSSKWLEFRIFSASVKDESTEHCRGLVCMSDSTRKLSTSIHDGDVRDYSRDHGWVELDGLQIFRSLHALGNEYSGCFASLTQATVRAWETRCQMIVPDVRSIMPSQYQQPHCLHPTILEAGVQACLPGLQAADCADGAFVVSGIDEVFVSTDMDSQPGERLVIETRTGAYGRQVHSGRFVVKAKKADEEGGHTDGEAVIAVERIRFSSMGGGEGRPREPLCHQIDWVVDPLTTSVQGVSDEVKLREMASPMVVTEIVIIADDSSSEVATALRDGLRGRDPSLEVMVRPLSDLTGTSTATCIVLLETSSELLLGCSGSEWTRLKETLCGAQTILWVTRGAALACPEPQRGLAVGLGRALRLERPGCRFYTLDLDPERHEPTAAAASIMHVYEQHLGPNKSPDLSSQDWEFAVRDGCILVPRVVENKAVNEWVEDAFSKHHTRETHFDSNRSLGLQIQSAGRLDTLYWADVPAHSQPPSASQIRIRTDYISLNFKDVMIAMGQLDGQSTLLIEGSGTVLEVGDPSSSDFSIGDKVCFFAPEGLATICNVDVDLATLIPKGMDMDTAASLPVAYATALYALRDVGRVQPGESVLIHSGAGAVGQAAISIAQHLGVKDIFVTAGNDERRSFVRDKFGIPSTHILSSRDAKFCDEVLRLTDSRGVDVVVNSLSGDLLTASLGTLAPFGRFVELGKKDILTNGRLEMRHVESNITLSTVDLGLMTKKRPMVYRRLLRACVELVQEGKTRAIEPIHGVHVADVEGQFRALQTGNHIGKSVLKVDASRPIKVRPPRPKPAELRNDGTYLVVSSGRGIDHDIIKYLASHGAGMILFLSRLGDAEDANMQRLIRQVRDRGSEMILLRGDMGDLSEKWALEKLKAANREMPIRGVIQGLTPHQPFNLLMEFTTPLAWRQNSIARGTLNIFDHLVGPELDFFIVMGSDAGVLGALGQGMEAANSAFLDAFARSQASLGRPVRAIDIGLIGEGESASFLSVLDYAIQNPVAATPAEAQILCGLRLHSCPDARFGLLQPDFSPVARDSAEVAVDLDVDIGAALRAATSKEAAVDAVLRGMKTKMTHLLALTAGEVRPDRSVASYGVDSLIAVELRNWVGEELGSWVQTLEVMSPMEMGELAGLLAKRSRLVPVGVFKDADQ